MLPDGRRRPTVTGGARCGTASKWYRPTRRSCPATVGPKLSERSTAHGVDGKEHTPIGRRLFGIFARSSSVVCLLQARHVNLVHLKDLARRRLRNLVDDHERTQFLVRRDALGSTSKVGARSGNPT